MDASARRAGQGRPAVTPAATSGEGDVLRVALVPSTTAADAKAPLGEPTSIQGCFCTLMAQTLYRRVSVDSIVGGQERGFFLVRMNAGDNDLDTHLKQLPADCLASLRQGQAGVIFDHSGEGRPHRDEGSERWHATFRDLEISPSRAVFLTQTRSYASRYADWCRRQGLTEQVSVLNYDYHIKKFFTKSWQGNDQHLSARLQHFDARRDIEKQFVCLSFKPRPWRIALLTRILKDELWDDGFISFGGLEQERLTKFEDSYVWRSGGPVHHFRKLPIAKESEQQIEALAEKGQILFDRFSGTIGNSKRVSDLVLDMHSDLYARSAFSLIPESEMNSFRHRITEKPFKALSNLHPIILFGNFKSLPLIKRLGFKTFDRWIDESYDEIKSPAERFRAAYREFRTFLPKARQLVLEDGQLRDVLRHNLENALITLPRHYEETIDRKLCRKILRAVPLG